MVTPSTIKNSLIHPARYFERYGELLPTVQTGMSAWKKLEEELYESTGLRRCISYETFRRQMRNFMHYKRCDTIRIQFPNQ